MRNSLPSPTAERGSLLLDGLLASFIGALLALGVVQSMFFYQQRLREDITALYLDEVHRAAEAYAASEALQATRTDFRANPHAAPVSISISTLKGAGLLPPDFPSTGPYGAPTITYKPTLDDDDITYLNISVRMGETTPASAGRVLNSMKTSHKGFFDGDVALRWHHGGQAGEEGIKAFLGEDETTWQGEGQILTASTLPLTYVGNVLHERRVTIRINQEALHQILQDTLYYNSKTTLWPTTSKIASDPQPITLRSESDAYSIADRFRLYVANPLRASNFDYAAQNPNASTTNILRGADDPNPSIDPTHSAWKFFSDANGLTFDSLKEKFEAYATKKSPSDFKKYRDTVDIKPYIIRNGIYHFHEDFSPGYHRPNFSDTTEADPLAHTFEYGGATSEPADAYVFNDYWPSGTDEDLNSLGLAYYLDIPYPATPEELPDGSVGPIPPYRLDDALLRAYRSYGQTRYHHGVPPYADYRWLEHPYLGNRSLFRISQFTVESFYDSSYGRYLPSGVSWTSPFTAESIQQTHDQYIDEKLWYDAMTTTENPERFNHPAVYGQPIIGRNLNDRLGFTHKVDLSPNNNAPQYIVDPGGSGYDIPTHVCPDKYIPVLTPQQDITLGEVDTNLPMNNIRLHPIASAHVYRHCIYTYPPSDNALRGPAYMLTPPDTGADSYTVTIDDLDGLSQGDCIKTGTMHARRTGDDAAPCLAWVVEDGINGLSVLER